jgi:hypothetical protein
MEKNSKTIFSFSAGPSVLPKEVLKKAQEELVDWHGSFLETIILLNQIFSPRLRSFRLGNES